MKLRRLHLCSLESRLAPATLFVDNPGDFVITNDTAPLGALNNGDTVTWDPGTGTGHSVGPQTGLIFGTTAFSTIASAIAAAAATGDQIRVGPGSFAETLTVTKALNIQGNQVGVDATTRTGAPETIVTSAGTAFTVSQSNARINGFTILGSGSGSTGIGVDAGLGGAIGMTVSNNIIADHNTGLKLNTAAGGGSSSVRFNLFQDNDSTSAGIAIRSDLWLENVTIADNVVTGAHPGGGIEIAGVNGTGKDLLLERNVLSGPGTGTADGIRIGSSVPASIQVAIRYNFVNDWDVGVMILADRDGITVRGNHLGGNGSRALLNAGFAVLDAGFNYYGVTTEAGVAAEVIGPFDTHPFLTEGADADPAARGFQPVLRPTPVTATTTTYTDPDGDLVTVKVSKGSLADADFTFFLPERGDGLILGRLNLGDDGAEFAGANVTITARRTAAGGDGLASQVQMIDATGVDLGTVLVRGDLGGLFAGDTTTTADSPAVKKVDVLAATAGAGVFPVYRFVGHVGAFLCRGDLAAFFDVTGGGSVGSLVIGGSVLPFPGIDSLAGSIGIAGEAKSVTIRGDLMGALGVVGNLGRLTVGGNLRGGAGAGMGKVGVNGNVGVIVIGGSLIGGTNFDTGLIEVNGDVGRLTVGGSLRGGADSAAGSIQIAGKAGAIVVGGSLIGGTDRGTGMIAVEGHVTSLTVRGSVVGGFGTTDPSDTGTVEIGSAGKVLIGGDLIGGNDLSSGRVLINGDVAGLTVRGSVLAGRDASIGFPTGGIEINGRAGPIAIGRDLRSDIADMNGQDVTLRPVTISVLGRPAPATQADALAFKSLTIGGSVFNAQILVGYDGPFNARNPDAAAGPVLVKGGWTASTLAVGVQAGADNLFGTADDAAIAPSGPFTDAPGVLARVTRLTVRGPVTGSGPLAGFSGQFDTDHFGFVAEVFGAVTIAGTVLPLSAAADQFGIGPTLDLQLLEV
jgi:hypothetical protein